MKEERPPIMEDRINARLFPETHNTMRVLMGRWPDRWESESHFIRSAILFFSRELLKNDNESLSRGKYVK